MSKSTFRFLHAADLHLDSPLRGLEKYEAAPTERIRNATRRAFEALVRRARELRVEFVILAGDLFDGDLRDFNSALWFAARLRELTNDGIRVYLLAGNHDAEGRMTRDIAWPTGVRVFATSAPETVIDEPTGAVLHGQGFAKAETTDDLASRYPSARSGALNIGVLHTALDGREGHGRYAPCSKDTLIAKGYDYWALGHVHQREVVSRQPWIVFPGNLQARHVRELGAKGATVVSVREGRIESVEHESFDVVRFSIERIDVTRCTRRGECVDAVESALEAARGAADGRMLAARVEIVGASAVHIELHRERETFVTECRDRGNALRDVWLEKIVIATKAPPKASGGDVIEQLALDDSEQRRAALAAARQELDTLLEKLPPGLDLVREGLDLRDETSLMTLLEEARDEVVLRLLDSGSESETERGR